MAGGDCTGYYMYLPAVLLQHDLRDLKQTIYERDKAAHIQRDSTKDITDVGEVYFNNNTPIIKYTCGIAILESPAFLLAHIIAKALNQPDTGFSKTYIFTVQLWNLLFAFVGLCLLAFVLAEFFQNHDSVIALTLFAVAVCTNLYHFVVYNTGMSHPYLFTLYAILLYSTINFYKNYNTKHALLIGISTGMITLVRPNEIICLLIPILYGVPQISGFKDRTVTLFKSKSFYLAIILFAICALPQLLYWKSLTGHWLYYSYGKEAFDFKHSKISGGLFGFKNGWLPYTPIMIFAIAGLAPMFLQKGKTLLATLVFLPLHIYIIYSWWCWNYINGLGSRPMIETYALLSIPLGSFGYLALKNKVLRYCWPFAIAFFACQQLMMTYQSSKDILISEDSCYTYYITTIFKPYINLKDVTAFDTDEKQPEGLVFKHLIYLNDFEDSVNPNFVRNTCGNGNFSFLLDSKIKYTPAFQKTIKQCSLKPFDWVKISFDNCNLPPSASLYGFAAMSAEFNRKGHSNKRVFIRIQNKLQNPQDCGLWIFPFNVSGNVSFFTQVPGDAEPDDSLTVMGLNFSESRVAIDNLRIEAFRR